MENHKSGFVNIIGNPNAGKSTLLNALVGEKLSIVSPKVQTTRQRILGIVTQPGYQLVFSDTPGILEPKYELQQSMVDSINEALDDADVLLIIISVWEKRNDWELWIERIKSLEKPFIVLINKIDEVDEVKLADNIKLWAEKFGTQNVIPISALKGINLDKIIPALLPFVPVSPPYYDGEELTDKSERFIVAEMIREKIFSLYKEEIPYSVEVMVQEFKDEETIIKIRADIFTERESQKGILLGKGGSAIKKLGIESRKEIEKFLNKNIFLGAYRSGKGQLEKRPSIVKKIRVQKMNNTVAIIGRPNVGKSTLYNRLIGERRAIVDDTSGVTRDRLYGVSEWNGKTFNLIDTGGFVKNSNEIFEAEIRKQVKIAIDEANVLLFVVDVTVGVTDLELEITDMLRRTTKKVIVVVNKVDNTQRMYEANEFYSLGFESIYFISSLSGSGTGELLDEVVQFIDNDVDKSTEGLPKFAIVGQPNVGKSSMLNALLGEERNIVTDIAGTTRDPIHTHYKLFQKEFLLIDTAGIRKKAKVEEDLEFYSVIRAIRALEEADVLLLMIDAHTTMEAQDLKIFSLAESKHKGVVIIVNKWDTVEEKSNNTMKEKEEAIRHKIAPFRDVPIIFTSVTEKQRIFKVIETGLEVYENRLRKISTSDLNEVLRKAIEEVPPPSVRGQFLKINYITQLPTSYPLFALFCNHPDDVKTAYKNYLEKKIRSHFNFTGVPIQLSFRKK